MKCLKRATAAGGRRERLAHTRRALPAGGLLRLHDSSDAPHEQTVGRAGSRRNAAALRNFYSGSPRVPRALGPPVGRWAAAAIAPSSLFVLAIKMVRCHAASRTAALCSMRPCRVLRWGCTLRGDAAVIASSPGPDERPSASFTANPPSCRVPVLPRSVSASTRRRTPLAAAAARCRSTSSTASAPAAASLAPTCVVVSTEGRAAWGADHLCGHLLPAVDGPGMMSSKKISSFPV